MEENEARLDREADDDILASEVEEVAMAILELLEAAAIIFCSELFATIMCDDASLAFEVASTFDELWDPVSANKLALKCLASTTPSTLLEAFPIAAIEVVALTSLELEAEAENFMELLCSEYEDISALAAASIVIAVEAEGAVLGRCLHLCRL